MCFFNMYENTKKSIFVEQMKYSLIREKRLTFTSLIHRCIQNNYVVLWYFYNSVCKEGDPSKHKQKPNDMFRDFILCTKNYIKNRK